MPKANSPVFMIHFAEHPEFGKVEPWAEAADVPEPMDVDALIDAAAQTVRFATLSVAGKYVGPDPLETDDEYLARNSEVARQLKVSSMHIVPESLGLPEGSRPSEYLLQGADWEQRDWTGNVRATNPAEAEFQARWQMALGGQTAVQDIEEHIAAMERAIVTRCEPLVCVASDTEVTHPPHP